MEKFLIVDTETANSLEQPLMYDFGYAVIDKQGNVYENGSYVVAEVFFDKELMSSAYYREKMPIYIEQINNGESKLIQLHKLHKLVYDIMQKYNICKVIAHNARFDYISTVTTQRYLTSSKYRYFFPYGVEICDTLKMARDVIAKMPTYQRFCKENGYLTKNGQYRLTAEILYRFITKDNDFVESHTGLEDVLIEKEILAYCYKQHKKMRKSLFQWFSQK